MSVKIRRGVVKASTHVDNLECIPDAQPSLFLQAFCDWDEKERSDFSKWQFLRHVLEEFYNDKKFLTNLLAILDPMQRKDAVYYEVATFKEETMFAAKMEKFTVYQFDDSENEEFLKQWFRHFDEETKKALILKVLKKVNDRHLLCLTKLIRWRLFELEELAGDEDFEKEDKVKVKQRRKKLGTTQKHGSWSEHSLLGLSRPTKYFVNFVIFLPLSITKKIFKHLDRVSILNCLKVSKGWKYLAQEVIDEKWTSVGKENNDGGSRSANNSSGGDQKREKSCLHNPYNMILVTSMPDSKRVVDFREEVVSFTTSEKNSVTLVRKPFEYEAEKSLGESSNNRIGRSLKLGHVGTVKAILMFCSKGFLISCRYDATIRKWSIKTGKCLKIYTGHGDVVRCLGNHGDILVSGSYDKSCRKIPVTRCCRNVPENKQTIRDNLISRWFCQSVDFQN